MCSKRYYRSSHLSVHMQKHYEVENVTQQQIDPNTFRDNITYSNLSPADGSDSFEPGLVCIPEIELGEYEVTQTNDFEQFASMSREHD